MNNNFGYEVKITNSNAEEILLSNLETAGDSVSDACVTTVCFRKKTDTTAGNRGTSVSHEFYVAGELNKTTKTELKKLAEWSLDSNRDTMYRKVEIRIAEDSSGDNVDKVYRDYSFTNMYVVTYEENFAPDADNPSDGGHYTLLIGQKAEKSEHRINV